MDPQQKTMIHFALKNALSKEYYLLDHATAYRISEDQLELSAEIDFYLELTAVKKNSKKKYYKFVAYAEEYTGYFLSFLLTERDGQSISEFCPGLLNYKI